MDATGHVEDQVRSEPQRKHPFRRRLHAWWHGYRLPPPGMEPAPETELALPDPVVEAEQEAEPEQPEAAPEEQPVDAENVTAVETEKIEERRLRIESVGWPSDRVDIAQMVWGRGFASPGNENHLLNITKPLELTATQCLMQIGVGLGGVASAISKAYGCKVTGWDIDEAQVSEAVHHQNETGTNFKVSAFHLDPATFEAKTAQFEAALIHEHLFLIEQKEAVLRKVVESLKPTGRIVMFDLMFEKDNFPEAVAQWATKEVRRVYPLSPEAAIEMLENMGIEIETKEDESDLYTAMALKEWANFTAKVEKTPPDPDFAATIVKEVEYWTRRVAAIDSGGVRVYHVCGRKSHAEAWG